MISEMHLTEILKENSTVIENTFAEHRLSTLHLVRKIFIHFHGKKRFASMGMLSAIIRFGKDAKLCHFGCSNDSETYFLLQTIEVRSNSCCRILKEKIFRNCSSAIVPHIWRTESLLACRDIASFETGKEKTVKPPYLLAALVAYSTTIRPIRQSVVEFILIVTKKERQNWLVKLWMY